MSRRESDDVCVSSLSRTGLRRFPQPCDDFSRREGEAKLVLDVHADGGGDDVGVVGVDRRKEKLCTSVGLRVDLVESTLPLQRIEHHPRDLRFARRERDNEEAHLVRLPMVCWRPLLQPSSDLRLEESTRAARGGEQPVAASCGRLAHRPRVSGRDLNAEATVLPRSSCRRALSSSKKASRMGMGSGTCVLAARSVPG